MKIEYTPVVKTSINDLKIGETFVYGGVVYMKIERLTKGMVTVNAVRLEKGDCFDMTEYSVMRVDTKVVMEAP